MARDAQRARFDAAYALGAAGDQLQAAEASGEGVEDAVIAFMEARERWAEQAQLSWIALHAHTLALEQALADGAAPDLMEPIIQSQRQMLDELRALLLGDAA